MNICMLAYTFYETDNRVRRYAEALAKRGDYVDVIALRRPSQERLTIIKNVHVHRIQKRAKNERFKLAYLFKLVGFLISSSIYLSLRHIKKRYKLIHVHSVPDFQVFSSWFVKLTGAKVILDIHDIVPELYASKFNVSHHSFLFKLLLWCEKLSAAVADHVIIANHLWHQKLISRSVKKEKCTVVMNYPDPDIFYKRQPSLKKGKFTLLYPGTLSRHQGLDTAIKALALKRERLSNIELHIFGDGTDKAYFQELVQKLGMEDVVHFKGTLPLDKIADVMADADIGIEPKRNNSFSDEAFSTKIWEFMSLGVPVIASDTKIHKHYFDESALQYFQAENANDLADSIELLQKNKSIRNRLIKNGYRYSHENNWGVKKYEYLGLVDSLIQNQVTTKKAKDTDLQNSHVVNKYRSDTKPQYAGAVLLHEN